MRAREFIREAKSYQAPEIKTGDEVKVGKFKNRRAIVKSITKDKHNQPVLQTNKGEHKLFKPRIDKLEEGGWEDTITQKTKLNPAIVKEALRTVEVFVTGLNKYLHSQGIDLVKMGHPLGSTAYVNVDTDETEYGDIDMQMIAPEIEGKSSFQITKFYNDMIDQFIAKVKPDYIYDKGKPTNGHPIFKLGEDVYVQVDMLWTTQRLSKWDRWRKTPMQGIKGLITGNLYSTLGEVINMSLQSAVLMKIKDGEPINFQRGRKPDQVIEVTSDIEHFGTDILKFVYEAVNNGDSTGMQLDPELKAYPGLKTANVQITDLVHTVKGLAKSFELNNLYGKHVLKDYSNAQELVSKYLAHYLDKADKAGRGAKLDKAETPAELAKVQELRDKIAKGVAIVKQAFAAN